MQQTKRNGGMILMHAENGPVIDILAAAQVAAGVTDPIGHGLARDSRLEGEATSRMIRLAEIAGVPVYFVHMSAKEALDALMAARNRGVMAWAETCPQYLYLTLDDLGNGFNGAKFVCRRRSAPGTTRWSSGTHSSATTSRRSALTTARSTSTARRSSGAVTSARSPTDRPAWRSGST